MKAYARTSDPLTSDEAADRVPVNRLEEVCLRHLQWRYPEGMTSYELALASGLSLVTISPRLKPLETKGCVYRNGIRRQGRQVWFAVQTQGRLF